MRVEKTRSCKSLADQQSGEGEVREMSSRKERIKEEKVISGESCVLIK